MDLQHLLARHELGLDRQLVSGPQHGLPRQRLGDARELEHDAPRLDHRNPSFGVPLARALPSLGRLLGHGLVWEDVDPDLAATADMARHRDSGRLDLTIGDPARFDGHEPVVTVVYGRPTLAQTPHATALLLAVLDLAWLQHL